MSIHTVFENDQRSPIYSTKNYNFVKLSDFQTLCIQIDPYHGTLLHSFRMQCTQLCLWVF